MRAVSFAGQPGVFTAATTSRTSSSVRRATAATPPTGRLPLHARAAGLRPAVIAAVTGCGDQDIGTTACSCRCDFGTSPTRRGSAMPGSPCRSCASSLLDPAADGASARSREAAARRPLHARTGRRVRHRQRRALPARCWPTRAAWPSSSTRCRRVPCANRARDARPRRRGTDPGGGKKAVHRAFAQSGGHGGLQEHSCRSASRLQQVLSTARARRPPRAGDAGAALCAGIPRHPRSPPRPEVFDVIDARSRPLQPGAPVASRAHAGKSAATARGRRATRGRGRPRTAAAAT